MGLTRVVIESPVAATDVYSQEQHFRYFLECVRDCVMNYDEFPHGSHWLAQGALDDDNPKERGLGIVLQYLWGEVAEKVIVYKDLGLSPGMIEAIKHWNRVGKPVEERTLGWDIVKLIQEMSDP